MRSRVVQAFVCLVLLHAVYHVGAARIQARGCRSKPLSSKAHAWARIRNLAIKRDALSAKKDPRTIGKKKVDPIKELEKKTAAALAKTSAAVTPAQQTKAPNGKIRPAILLHQPRNEDTEATLRNFLLLAKNAPESSVTRDPLGASKAKRDDGFLLGNHPPCDHLTKLPSQLMKRKGVAAVYK